MSILARGLTCGEWGCTCGNSEALDQMTAALSASRPPLLDRMALLTTGAEQPHDRVVAKLVEIFGSFLDEAGRAWVLAEWTRRGKDDAQLAWLCTRVVHRAQARPPLALAVAAVPAVLDTPRLRQQLLWMVPDVATASPLLAVVLERERLREQEEGRRRAQADEVRRRFEDGVTRLPLPARVAALASYRGPFCHEWARVTPEEAAALTAGEVREMLATIDSAPQLGWGGLDRRLVELRHALRVAAMSQLRERLGDGSDLEALGFLLADPSIPLDHYPVELVERLDEQTWRGLDASQRSSLLSFARGTPLRIWRWAAVRMEAWAATLHSARIAGRMIPLGLLTREALDDVAARVLGNESGPRSLPEAGGVLWDALTEVGVSLDALPTLPREPAERLHRWLVADVLVSLSARFPGCVLDPAMCAAGEWAHEPDAGLRARCDALWASDRPDPGESARRALAALMKATLDASESRWAISSRPEIVAGRARNDAAVRDAAARALAERGAENWRSILGVEAILDASAEYHAMIARYGDRPVNPGGRMVVTGHLESAKLALVALGRAVDLANPLHAAAAVLDGHAACSLAQIAGGPDEVDRGTARCRLLVLCHEVLPPPRWRPADS